MDIECVAQQFFAHRRTFDVPAGSAGAPRAVPRRLARFGRFPECEIGDVPLPFAAGAAFTL